MYKSILLTEEEISILNTIIDNVDHNNPNIHIIQRTLNGHNSHEINKSKTKFTQLTHKSKEMNIKQYDLCKEALEACRQIVYEHQEGVKCKYLENKICYLQNLIKEYDDQEK